VDCVGSGRDRLGTCPSIFWLIFRNGAFAAAERTIAAAHGGDIDAAAPQLEPTLIA
jgi:hypothetical protein